MKKILLSLLLLAMTANLCACKTTALAADSGGTKGRSGAAVISTDGGETRSQSGATVFQAGGHTGNLAYTAHSGRGWYNGGSDDSAYTKADYDYAIGLKLDGYESMSVEDYNKKVLNWDDETAYHKTEDILRKVYRGLADDDPNLEFFKTTLSNTWEECSSRHYNACHQQKPSYSGSASRETWGDIYGDQVLLTGAYVDFWFDYEVTDGKKTTVAQRDSALKSFDADLKKLLDQCSDTDLKDEKAMEKKLTARLEELLGKGIEGLTLAGKEHSSLNYYYDAAYEYSGYSSGNATASEDTASGNRDYNAQSYTKQQYDNVINTLKFPGYENMSIAEFNRKVHNALNDYEANEDLDFDYEMVMMYIKDSDANAAFLKRTIPTALNEYDARAMEVYTGKTVDPSCSAQAQMTLTADVYGDQVETGMCMGDYSFNYHIADADQLTVAQRDAFIDSITTAVQTWMDAVDGDNLPTESQFKAAIEKAGKAAGNDKIQFTQCEIEYFEAENYR